MRGIQEASCLLAISTSFSVYLRPFTSSARLPEGVKGVKVIARDTYN